jgi:hypothetical protein
VVADYWDWRLAFNTGSAFSMFSVDRRRAVAPDRGRDRRRPRRALHDAEGASPTRSTLHWALAPGRQRRGRQPHRPRLRSARSPTSWSGSYQGKEWPAFNIADVALVVGVVLIFISSFKEPTEPAPPKARAQALTRGNILRAGAPRR